MNSELLKRFFDFFPLSTCQPVNLLTCRTTAELEIRMIRPILTP